MTEPTLAIAVSAREWPDRLRRWLADHGGARVRLTAFSARDVEEDQHDVFLIDDISSLLTRGLVRREQASGRKVIGVHDPSEPSGRHLLTDLGVDALVACDETAEAFLATAREVAIAGVDLRPVERPGPASPRAEVGSLVDLRGISGGVGTSEVTLALSQWLTPSVVVELCDLPSLAQRMGLDLHPNFVTAVEALDHGVGDPTAALQHASATAVLVGSTDPGASGRGAARRVIDSLRGSHAWTLVDGGTRAAVAGGASHRVFVSLASPVGITRCLDALRHEDLLDTHVVLNRATRGAFRRAETLHAVLEEIQPRSVTILPEDPSVPASAWNGHGLTSGPFFRAVESLAAAIARVP